MSEAVDQTDPSAPTPVRMVVISDIHATNKIEEHTHVAQDSASDQLNNALTSIRPFLAEAVGNADLLICPGDLVDHGKTKPIKWVWEELTGIAGDLGAELIGSVGNHDLALKPGRGRKPDSALRQLDPKFPYTEQACFDAFWAHGFAIIDHGPWRVLLVNSSDHLGGFNEDEAEHGRFGTDCEKPLLERLDKSEAAVNICVFHHHPQPWTFDTDQPVNHMLGGDRLIGILEQRPEPWMIVHGHTHFPRLDYTGNRSGGPVRLASGSIGANLLGISGIKVRNQMHLVEFDLAAAERLGLRVAGRVYSYDWIPGEGWGQAMADSGLPASASFGYRRDGYELARWLERESSEQRTWRWEELVEIEPRLEFLAEGDRADFFAAAERIGAGVQEGIMEVTFP